MSFDLKLYSDCCTVTTICSEYQHCNIQYLKSNEMCFFYVQDIKVVKLLVAMLIRLSLIFRMKRYQYFLVG